MKANEIHFGTFCAKAYVLMSMGHAVFRGDDSPWEGVENVFPFGLRFDTGKSVLFGTPEQFVDYLTTHTNVVTGSFLKNPNTTVYFANPNVSLSVVTVVSVACKGFRMVVDAQRVLAEQYKKTLSEFYSLPKEKRLAHKTLAMLMESFEALDQTSWRYWRKSQEIDQEKFAEELADVLHFFLESAIEAGIDGETLVGEYYRKNLRNLLRQKGHVDTSKPYITQR